MGSPKFKFIPFSRGFGLQGFADTTTLLVHGVNLLIVTIKQDH